MYVQFKTSYEREISILKDINKARGLVGFLKFFDCGFDQLNNVYFIVTELLGSDIMKLMMKCEGRKFKPETALKIGL